MRVVTVAERPDLMDKLWGFTEGWAEFMLHDPVAMLMRPLAQRYPQLQLLLLDDDGACVGKGHAVPLEWDGNEESLPDRGWDQVQLLAARVTAPTAASALEINVRPALRGKGLSAVLLDAMRTAVRDMGLADLFAPVRPSQKHLEPLTPMDEYAFRTRDDGLPTDAWLRVHARAGGRIVRVCPLSMTIAGTLPEWRAWTGLPFDTDGDTIVPGALAPVTVSLSRDVATYVEPNVWVRHHVAPN
jgi:GNAT superfamily N-acetyltransferase